MKIRVSVKKPYGEVTIEGESFEELSESLKSYPEWIDFIDSLIAHSETPRSKKETLKGIIEYINEGPVISVPKEKLNDKEAICLIIYANEPNPLQPKTIAKLLTLSGRLSAGFGARLSELRNEGIIAKDAGAYRLTTTGTSMVENILSKLK